MGHMYTYTKIRGKYLCLDTGMMSLFWYLLIKFNALHHEQLKLSKKSSLRLIVGLMQSRITGKQTDRIKLPVKGHLCFPVHRGYKIFNYSSCTVTKVFNTNVPREIIENEIEQISAAARLTHAPQVGKVSIEDNWYTEEYIPGEIRGYSQKNIGTTRFSERVNALIIPCLSEMQHIGPKKTVRLHDYTKKIIISINTILAENNELDSGKTDKVRAYVEKYVRKLQDSVNIDVRQVFSHGDFSLVNILNTEKGIKVIDWEGAASRSTYNDFYNYFLTELYYDLCKTDLVDEVEFAYQKFNKVNNLEEKNDRDVYRWLFYIERMLVLIERDISEKIMDVVFKSIDVFEQFEQNTVASRSLHE